ncbi:MAG: hydrogenase nickel incorporation protein HypA, partial [Candidatus Thermoplasmatota archaeon]|nr:hydrogenase nickel incorporation protein HypA [Candidatus Thermoplasmatota archaeon]
MHEWALAESVIATIVKAAEERGVKKVELAVVKLGEMQGIDRSIFDFALKEISKTRTAMAKAKIKIEMISTKFRCKSCKNEWNYDKVKKKVGEEEAEDIHFIPEVVFAHTRCPKCGGVD